MRVLIIKFRKHGRVQEVQVRRGQAYSIGRHSENHIVVDDLQVSRQQAEIKSEGERFYLKNVGQGVVHVNTHKVPAGQKMELRAGYVIRVGSNLTIEVLAREEVTLDMVICPKCKRQVERATSFCPFCGGDLSGAKTLLG